MDARSFDKVKHVLNTDVVRRLLIRYFREKGFNESFERTLYPPSMQDVAELVPQLASKLEVVPHAVNVNPANGTAVLGWNLFVLGCNRMYLGETYHRDVLDLTRQLRQGRVEMAEGAGSARRMCTPRQVVNFVVRVLARHEAGYVDLDPPQRQFSGVGGLAPGGSNQFYRRSGYGTG